MSPFVYIDLEIDNLLNAIVRNDSDKDVITSLSDTASHHSPDDSLSIQDDDDSMEDQNSLVSYATGSKSSPSHQRKKETTAAVAATITIQTKGLMPSRRNRRKLRKQQLLNNPTNFKPTMRVMKRDIRKKYCEMMNNVINNQDTSLVKQFLEQFCLPDVNIYDPVPNGPASISKSKPCHIIGIDDITNTWNTGFQLMPDFTFQLYDSYIYATPNHQRSRIVSKVTFHGTKVFNLLNDLPYLSSLLTCSSSSSSLEDYQQLPQVKSILDLVRNSIGTQNLQQVVQLFNKSPSNDNVMQTDTMKEQHQINDENQSFSSTANNPLLDNYQIFNLMSCFQQLSLLSKPIHYTIEGILTTFLDESNRILRFQFDCSKLQPDIL